MATSSTATTISPERKNSTSSSSSSMKQSISAASLADLNTGGEEDENPGITYKTAERGPKKVNQYILGELLGEGAYGKVREAIDSRTLKRVAIKIIKRTKLKRIKGAEENLRNEINILRRMKHDNVIRLIEVIHNEDKQKIYIITEFAGAGSLQQVMESHLPHKRLPPADAHHFFRQLILGLEYIHNQGVIHRDIKPSNLMITPDRVLKISDFGVARELGFFDKDDLVSNSFGSPAFQSPQIASGQKNFSGYKLDIWAAGVTLYNMVTGTTPFTSDNVFELFEQIAKAQFTIPEYVPEPIQALIRGMLEKDEETRFTIQQIKEHEWFKQSSPSNDKPVPLVERWKSHSLVPYIAKAVGGSSGSSNSSPNPAATTLAPPEKRNSISLSSLAGRRKSIFLPSFKADSNFAEGEDPLQGENPKCNIL